MASFKVGSESAPTKRRSSFGMLDSLLVSLESGIDKMIHKVDETSIAVAQFINVTLDEASTNPDNADLEETYKSNGKMTPFFGSSLKELVLDESRCTHANLNPLLGIPNQAVKMITFISNHINTPQLFRQSASRTAVAELRRFLEEERGLPPGVDISTVTHVFMQWLNQLPEPLLGYEHYEAIMACHTTPMEDESSRQRNFALLAQEAPWYCKPLLAKVMTLLGKCVQPGSAATNKLNVVAVAVMSTPFLLRPFILKSLPMRASAAEEEADRALMIAAAKGSATVEYLITHEALIFAPIRNDLIRKQENLAAKCAMVRSLQEKLLESINCSKPDSLDTDKVQLVRKLWNQLSATESILTFVPSPVRQAEKGKFEEEDISEKDNSLSMNLSELLAHPRWAVCGFVSLHALPLQDFASHNGMMALQCLAGFLDRYKDKGAAIVQDFVQGRKQFCSISQVACRLTHFVADALQLVPTPQQSSQTQIQRCSKHPAWLLLNDKNCFQDLFDVAMLSFDDAWKASCDKLQLLPTLETYSLVLFKCRQNLWDILAKKPKTVGVVWELWMQNRLADQEKLADLLIEQSGPAGPPRRSSSVDKYDPKAVDAAAIGTSSSDSTRQDNEISEAAQPPPETQSSRHILTEASFNNKTSVTSHNTQMADNHLIDSQAFDGANTTNRKDWNVDLEAEAGKIRLQKQVSGITSNVFGGSTILSERHIAQLEAALPQSYQCRDWRLIYRLTIHGANLETLLNKAQGLSATLLVLRDSKGGIFGALIPEKLRIAEKEKYYGNGTIGVWTFVMGSLRYYNWSYKNSYFLLSSKDSLALGGGGHFAIYLDGDLHHGSSGPCDTFSSPCLASVDNFICESCELFSLDALV